LEGALTQIPSHLILIQDNASYHTSGPLQTFYTTNADRLTIYQLPAYSPDLNPIEGIWQKVKEGATHLRYFPHFADLVTKVDTTLTTLAGTPD
jgi:transposase